MMLSLSSTDIQLPSPRPHGLAKYSDLTEMARGGNGVLYSAFDQIVGRTVVLKMLLPEHRLDRGFRRRLLREARVTAQLEHPGTVPVHEIGEDDEFGIYYAMKRISGENFFSVLRQLAKGEESVAAAFPLHRRIEIVRDTCQTLVFAHAAGVIHRDVKPENIWVGNFGEVTLLDWGAAKVWGEPTLDDGRYPTSPVRHSHAPHSESDKSSMHVKHEEKTYELPTLTPANQLIGTPTYMSPEQISNREVDERSDVFSAGVCLYEAMAIAEPFRGKNRDETFDNICMRQPTPPSERSPKQHIPEEADRIVFKAIAKQTTSRYQSMREMIADLDELLLIVRQDESD
ncbi:serine/threonine-protein kinase [Rhodopirellula islandica]|uniref:Serine/threonine-protein kinase n=1 Tax=Rhodopirellula islandica TaxID=595434 RepID=A0A0J1BIM8_RHOIS|nr:serine/threonine-protein kinase [Rhodopirellula islandica]KLU06386.1 serine/threonine-protein kinase [Rhodopirellula islandica]